MCLYPDLGIELQTGRFTLGCCSCKSGPCIGTDGHANVTLQVGSRVERCRATYGGGVGVFAGSAAKILDGSVLSECHGTSWAGGAFISGSGVPCHAEFVQSSILNCSGGFWVFMDSTLLATNCVRVPCSNLHTPLDRLPVAISPACPQSWHTDRRRLRIVFVWRRAGTYS